uniref:Si:ch211-194c3.5 n=1 Tax=Sphaeramia orbicularis TaxID=375764 RepID=A0A673C454_9TELE
MAGIRRVNGKYSGINPVVSCCRLRQVQSLLCDGGPSTPDGILCSLGIDSRYNEGCTELAKYLFYGLYGRKQLNLEHALEEFPEEMLDDVILLIKAECVHLYCNPLNYTYLLPYISHWRNLHLYCMTEAEYEDEEAAEEFKISSFVTMVQDCYRIGVPHSSQGHIQKFDMFMVEKWPLIQAFALEGIGGGSFFTMKYKVHLNQRYIWFDLGNFEKQWNGFFSSMDLESHLSILELSEAQAGEQPFVLFGRHSSLEDLENYSFNFPSESHQVRNTGPEGSTARHMVLQCVAPKGPLACSRTYFFGTTHTPYLADAVLFRILSQIYSAVVQAVLSGIKCYSSTSSPTKVKKKRQCIYFNLQRDRDNLGSVVFSESFLESSINIQQKGKIVFFSEGILFIHSQYGSITISKDHISSLKFYDPDTSAVASLFVEYEKSLLPHLPFPLHSADQCLVFALQPRSKSHRAFYSKVRPSACHILQGSGATLHMIYLPFSFRHSKLQKLHDSQEPPVAKRRGSMKTSYSQLPEQDMFLQHFALSSIGQEPILFDHLGALFPSAELRKPATSQGDKVVITIITGLPGSHKKRLCDFLVKFSKEHGRWVVYEPGPDSCDSFSASHLQQYLSSFLESQRGPRGKPRLLVLSLGYTDVLDVVQAVLFHPDPVVQACFTIGAVTACVDPLSSCMEHRFAFPKLLEQCSQGIVSTVVFTGLTAEQKHPLMQHVQQLVRSANPTAAFILAERGAVTRNEDVNLILSESCFNEPQMLRARYVLYPGWCKGRFFTGSGSVVLTQQRVAFTRPLERPLFVTRCKALSSLEPPDSDQMMEVTFNTVSGNLSIVPNHSSELLTPHAGETNASCFLIFDGVGLTEDGLKDWLRLCAKQKQAKKIKRTKNTLSPQEIKTIHMSRHLAPLPPGYFYNGYQYVDIFGEKRIFHPNMDEFINEYIAEANKEIELFNRQLELQGQPDLFDP